MKRPPNILTKQEFESQRQAQINRKVNEYKQSKHQFDMKSKERQQHVAAAQNSVKSLSNIDIKHRQLMSVLNMKLKAARHNRDLIVTKAASMMDTELIDDLNRSREDCERDIDELSGVIDQITNDINCMNSNLEELLIRYGSGAGNMGHGRVMNRSNSVAAIGSPTNTYDPNEPGARQRAIDKALQSSAAIKFGVDVSMMKEKS
jgi:hypothetical protein